ncbi:hypothetical protein [Salinimonas chungwhensis]|uniref:hypothetical protein n=1 Tax=Salinimonas chungwhensis TaxID=265425 RepID=UPI0003670166|nr:hypothetical protein [Salinimonas chungwhensis]
MIVARAINEKEPDLLVGYETLNLIIKDLGGEVVTELPPADGIWTHDALELVDYDKHSPFGWDAYLGDQWIGSSEV